MSVAGPQIRNIAIIAHVDHGKTTLVDAILRQTHAHRNIDDMGNCIMDSMDLEKERGITIRAKNASVSFRGVKINIVDTPGHADFGGEVERSLRMVEGVLLLIDAKDGPMPQTRFVLRKALELGLTAIVVVNKVDRQDVDPNDALNKTFDLFCELNASHAQLDFPIVYASGLRGFATLDPAVPSDTIEPLLEVILQKIPPPHTRPQEPLQLLVLALFEDFYKGVLALGKITSGSVRKNDMAALIRRDGTQVNARVTSLLTYRGLERVEVDQAQAGDIVMVAGFERVGIGETITDVADPRPLEPLKIDEPTVQMFFGVNTSPFSGREGRHVTSRALRDRLYRELETNVSLRVTPTDQADTFLVAGRGELHLAILIETLRREGFELQVSQPEVILHEKDGLRTEPFEFLLVDVPSQYQGTVIEEIGRRKGALRNLSHAPTGEVHLEYLIPTRGLIGLKGALLTKTRGTAILHHVFDEYRPMIAQDLGPGSHGSLIASEDGLSTSYGLNNAQERGELFIGPGIDVYQGMIIGQNARDDDLDLSPCKTKKLTNMRAAGSDEAIVLTPPREMSLDLAIEYIGPDELVEATPKSIRLRKKTLDPLQRKRMRRQAQDDA